MSFQTVKVFTRNDTVPVRKVYRFYRGLPISTTAYTFVINDLQGKAIAERENCWQCDREVNQRLHFSWSRKLSGAGRGNGQRPLQFSAALFNLPFGLFLRRVGF